MTAFLISITDTRGLLPRSKSTTTPFSPYLLSATGVAGRSLSVGVETKTGQVRPTSALSSRHDDGSFRESGAEVIELSYFSKRQTSKYHTKGSDENEEYYYEDDDRNKPLEWRHARRTSEPRVFPVTQNKL
jgi:hypothetical protein